MESDHSVPPSLSASLTHRCEDGELDEVGRPASSSANRESDETRSTDVRWSGRRSSSEKDPEASGLLHSPRMRLPVEASANSGRHENSTKNERVSLRRAFHWLGTLIGLHPSAFLCAGLLLALTSVGMYKMEVRDRIRDGYTPTTSRSRYETDVLKEFFGSIGDPLMTTVILRAKDNGSMHRIEYLEEAVRIHKFLRNNLTVVVDTADTPNPVGYTDFCGQFCDANAAIDYFAATLKGQLNKAARGETLSRSIRLTYPISRVGDYELHLERNFYGVKQIGDEGDSAANGSGGDDGALDAVTPIRYIEVVLMTFRGDIMHPGDEERMTKWEMRVYDYSKSEFNSSRLEMLVLGNEIVDRVMNEEAKRTAPYFILGFLFMFAFVFYTLLAGSFYFDLLDWAKPLLALGVSLCPVLSVTSTFGLFALLGLRTNSVMLIMPFLICGIGVNDAFLATHAWHRSSSWRRGTAAARRMGFVLEEVGPSITITTITNVITFAIGALTPTPEVSIFCSATAVALALAYVFTLLIYMPLVCFATVVEDAKERQTSAKAEGRGRHTDKARELLNSAFRAACGAYCRVIASRFFAAVLFVCQLAYWCFAVVGTMNISARLDTEKILPRGSPILEPHSIIAYKVWTTYYPLTVLINSPLDLRKSGQLDAFNAMVAEFEGLEQCKGKEFTILWLRDYITYVRLANEYDFDYESNETNEEDSISSASTSLSETGLDFTRLKQFLSSPIYKHHAAFMKLNETIMNGTTEAMKHGPSPVERFWFIVSFRSVNDWEARIGLMLKWRSVADKYGVELNVTVWEPNAIFIDQMLSLKGLSLQTVLLTLACMAVVCVFFIQNPASVLIAIGTIASISLGVMGSLWLWGMDLDPVTLCAVLMTIGMGVDFTAHVTYHFQLRERNEIHSDRIVHIPMQGSADKLAHTVRAIAWPMSQAGLSTVVCVLPLAFLQNYIPLVFVKTVTLVVAWGLYHGLIALPTTLFHLPATLLEASFTSLFPFHRRDYAQDAEATRTLAKK